MESEKVAYIVAAGYTGSIDEARSSVLLKVAEAKETSGIHEIFTTTLRVDQDETVSIILAKETLGPTRYFIAAWRHRDLKELTLQEVDMELTKSVWYTRRTAQANFHTGSSITTGMLAGMLLFCICFFGMPLYLGKPALVRSLASLDTHGVINYASIAVVIIMGGGGFIGWLVSRMSEPRHWAKSDVGQAMTAYVERL